jgi:hypothetical protein
MKKIRVDIETSLAGVGAVEYFEVPDDATNEEITDEAREIFFNYCNYGVSEVEEDEEWERFVASNQ